MPFDNLSILLVDDMKPIKSEIEGALKRIGIIADIDFRCPEQRDMPFGCAMPEEQEFDKYDMALVDLELFPPRSDITYSPEDLRGGTEVLPYIRKEAPWLPVIAESRLFTKEAEHFLSVGGSFGFDGHLPQQIFLSPFFNRRLWDGLLERAKYLRRRTVLGEIVTLRAHTPEIRVTDQVKEKLDSKFKSWHALSQAVFCFGDRVGLNPLVGGFSGASVFKAYVQQSPEDGGSEGEWILKTSNSSWKLHKEVQAHLAMLRAGVDHARIVPLLWPEVIVEDKEAAIAYKFSEGTIEASEILKNTRNASKLCTQLAPMFSRFYQNKNKNRDFIGKLIANWCGRTAITEGADKLQRSKTKELLQAIGEGRDIHFLGEQISYLQCRIHGDLHLGNIMIPPIGEGSEILIDFAKSTAGPIAVDAAKLISDILLRLPEARGEQLPSWDSSDEPYASILKPLMESFSFGDGDKKLFRLFLAAFLVIALRYDDVPADSKAWVKATISRTSFYAS